MAANEKSTGIDADQLQQILATVIAEVRKPAELTEEQKAAKEQDKEMRAQQALLALEIQRNRERDQAACLHQRRDGTTPAVYVANGNYMLCQHCQKIIRPEVETELFNRLMQLQTPAVF
jgi:hypothetical protein